MIYSKPFCMGVLAVLCLAGLLGCTFTQRYQPQFNKNETQVLSALKTKYGFQDVSFLAESQSGTRGKHTSLIVKFINGKNIPTDTTKMTAFAKQLGVQIKTILKTPNKFESYMILFDSVVSDGAVTKENYTGHEFSADDL